MIVGQNLLTSNAGGKRFDPSHGFIELSSFAIVEQGAINM